MKNVTVGIISSLYDLKITSYFHLSMYLSGVRHSALDDIGRKCGVNAKEADGLWLGMALSHTANEPHCNAAIEALQKGNQAKYKTAIDQMVCP